MVCGPGQVLPLFRGSIVLMIVLVFVPVFALQSLQILQSFQEQSTGQFMVCGSGQVLPLFRGAIVLLIVLVFVPVFALQSLQTFQGF